MRLMILIFYLASLPCAFVTFLSAGASIGSMGAVPGKLSWMMGPQLPSPRQGSVFDGAEGSFSDFAQ